LGADVKRRTAAISSLIFLLCLVIPAGARAQEGEGLELHAKAAVLLDGGSGRVLYGNKNSAVRLPMASTTKIMTCILVLEQGNLDDLAEVSAYAQSMPKVHLSVREGEFYRVSDLLYSLMLESHNDSAVVLAEYVGGSVEGFAGRMNQKAEEIGCRDTHFVTPNGLDDELHYTTAEDLAKMMRYCIRISDKREEFLAITRTASHAFTNYRKENGEVTAGDRSFTVNNKNAFLSMMEGALSGKTGFTSRAGYCYVGALERDGKCLIVALLACGWPGNKGWKWEDTRQLMEYGLSHFAYREWFSEPALPDLSVLGGKAGEEKVQAAPELFRQLINPVEKVPLCMERPSAGESRMLMGESDRVTETITLVDALEAPVEKGTAAGSVSYYLNGERIRSYDVTVGKTVEKIDYPWIAGRLIRLFALKGVVP
jgi:D-alanyl-D-alanine carboxypeptidase (penicillin-binding protein 5/6)